MKTLFLFTLLALPFFSFGQYTGLASEFFFGRHPSTRAESMGQAGVSLTGDLSTVSTNPASLATIEGLAINTALAEPYYFFDKAELTNINMSFKLHDFLTIGASRGHFNSGTEITFVDEEGNTFSHTPNQSTYALVLSSQPVKNLYFGIKTNYYTTNPSNEDFSTFYFDFGIIKRIPFPLKSFIRHSVNLGASIANFSNSSVEIESSTEPLDEELPMINRLGASYQLTLDKKYLVRSLNTLDFLLQSEFQFLANSQYHTAYRVGAELVLLEILVLRAGYYQEKLDDHDNPSNRSEFSELTYGYGFRIPLQKLTNVPLIASFDYTNLPQPKTNESVNFDNFSSYNLGVNWLLGHRSQ